MWSRRAFLARAAAVLGASIAKPAGIGARRRHAARRSATRLILLGTAGGPTPKLTRSAPSQVILFNGAAFVVDCGNGVARQLRLAGVDLRTIRHVFLTHHHSDHNADYGTLLLLAWGTNLTKAVDTWGPRPLERITRLFLELSDTDIQVRVADEGLPPLAPLIRPHEVGDAGVVVREGGLTVTCARVQHPLVKDAFAYRFDSPDRSIVISGDTAPSDALARLARDADVLVHEVLDPRAIGKVVGASPGASSLLRHLRDSHTPLDEVGRIATAARVKTLVLSHFVPSDGIDDEAWRDGAKANFKGEVIVGRDLLEI